MGVSSLGKDHTWEINLAARAAWMSYVGELTQSEIAKRLGVSSARVHRLIQLAKQHGIIRISIEGRPAECMHLEAEIAGQFGLKSCTISPYLADRKDNTDLSSLSVGQAAGQLLAQHLVMSQTRSVTVDPFGQILVDTFTSMPQFPRPDLNVWAATGCLSSTYQASNSEVLSLLEMRTEAQVGMIPAPYAPNTDAEFDSFNALPGITDALRSAAKSEIFVGQIKPADMADETVDTSRAKDFAASEAACRFLGSFFDANGQMVTPPAVPSTIHAPLDVSGSQGQKAAPRVFALAAGVHSSAPTLAALRAGIVTDLILDEALAETLTAAA
jgi:DNA-binding transcriptional regulator LsrR (DeoR family)